MRVAPVRVSTKDIDEAPYQAVLFQYTSEYLTEREAYNLDHLSMLVSYVKENKLIKRGSIVEPVPKDLYIWKNASRKVTFWTLPAQHFPQIQAINNIPKIV